FGAVVAAAEGHSNRRRTAQKFDVRDEGRNDKHERRVGLKVQGNATTFKLDPAGRLSVVEIGHYGHIKSGSLRCSSETGVLSRQPKCNASFISTRHIPSR